MHFLLFAGLVVPRYWTEQNTERVLLANLLAGEVQLLEYNIKD